MTPQQDKAVEVHFDGYIEESLEQSISYGES